MKKLIVICVILLLAWPVFAATKPAGMYGAPENPAVKGNFAVSLPVILLGFGMDDLYDNGRFFFLGANGYEPDVQYFIVDRLSVGGRFGYEYSKTDRNTDKILTFGPAANYYFNYMFGPTMPYAGAALLYQRNSNHGTIRDVKFQMQGGVIYMLGKNLSAYGQAMLSFDDRSNSVSDSGERFILTGGIRAFF